MEKAIKIAIANGWVHKPPLIIHMSDFSNRYFIECIYTDPLFWQALGRGLGWTSSYFYKNVDSRYWGIFGADEVWKFQWQIRFLNHLAEKKDIDSFFTDLVK